MTSGDTVLAIIVFLNLLERDANGIPKRPLGHADKCAVDFDAVANVGVNRARRAATFELATGLAGFSRVAVLAFAYLVDAHSKYIWTTPEKTYVL